jgi:FAD/FMN-containing dehydrogenase
MKKIDGFLTEIACFLDPSQISTSPDDLVFYAQDWSQTLTPRASAILFPKSTAEVAAILKSAHAREIPIVPSGGRTGLSGGAVATRGEVVLSLSKIHFMHEPHPGALTLQVGAGAVTEAVHRHCEPFGLTWPVDFASKGSSTIGGNIATNAGGVRVIRYGNTRNWVLGITAVTMQGEVLHFNQDLEKNNTGYDFRQLLLGSEGTLAVITEATLKLCPRPRSTLVALFSLRDFPSLLALFARARRCFPSLSAFECLDAASMESVRAHFRLPLPVSTPGAVYALLELENVALPDVQTEMEGILESGLVLDGVMAQNEKEAKALWAYREGVAESVLHAGEVHQEDVSVPVARLGDFYSTLTERYENALPGWKTCIFGHIGDGNLHIFIRKPEGLDTAEFKRKAHETDLELFKILARFNGSVSAEHGIGLLKKHAIHYSRSAHEIELMRGIKRSFDPKGLLNPGKIIDQETTNSSRFLS